MCPVCQGKWHAEHSRRRKWGRIIIKAMKFYQREGGSWNDFDKMKFAAGGIFESYGVDLLGYGADTIGAEVGDITAELLADTIQLTHPDKHPPERNVMATRVTQELLALKPFVFPAPPPEPKKARKPRDDSLSETGGTIKDPSQPKYPCEVCAGTTLSFYCDPCRAEWKKREQKEREGQNAKRRRYNAQQRQRYAARQWRRRSRLTACEGCSEQFKGKRNDARYCSAACRQRSYRQRREVGHA